MKTLHDSWTQLIANVPAFPELPAELQNLLRGGFYAGAEAMRDLMLDFDDSTEEAAFACFDAIQAEFDALRIEHGGKPSVGGRA